MRAWLREHDIAAGLLASLVFTATIALTTSPIPPSTDSINYVNVAEHGLCGATDLAAPFAYRFGAPLLVHGLLALSPLTVLGAFRLIAFLSAWGITAIAYLLPRATGGSPGQRLVTAAVAACSFFTVKFALAVPTMVDVEGMLLLMLAVWFLIKHQYRPALFTSCIGIFFKEFLLIPAALLVVLHFRDYLRRKATSDLAWAVGSLLLPSACFILPRILIPVSAGYGANLKWNFSGQSHWGYFENLRYFLSGAPTPGRIINLVFSLFSFWLPVLLLATPSRLRTAWGELHELRLPLGLLVVLVLFFALFGGTNIMIFVAYTLPAMVLLLAHFLRTPVHPAELTLMLIVVLIFNRIPWFAGGEGVTADDITQFYGGWWSLVDGVTLSRTIEMAGSMALLSLVRYLLHRRGSVGHA